MERRKGKRIKFPETFRVKARIRRMGNERTDYFDIEDLGMGGLKMTSTDGMPIFQMGEMLEILLFRKNLSLRLTAEVLEGSCKNEFNEEKKNSPEIRARIIGIDEKSRKMLALFIEELLKEGNLSESFR